MLLQSTSFLLHCNPKNSFCLSLQGVSEDVRECISGLAGIQAGRSETQSPGTETLLPKGSIREHGEFLFLWSVRKYDLWNHGGPSFIISDRRSF